MGLIIFGALLVLAGFLFLLVLIDDDSNKLKLLLGALFCTIGGAIIVDGAYEVGVKDIPTAMDVYQGKTTLQITYKDSIPVDSVVVFKEKE